jgi:DNA invertase Pin-like site-specific DNA recombinase
VVVEEYVDHCTGKKSDRDRFQQMFVGASRRQFDLLLFWSLDRFSREGALETLQHLQRLTASKVEWKSFTEQYLDSCGIFREAVLAILAVIAKQERIRLVERTRAGLDRYRRDFARGVAQSKTGKNLPPGRPRKIVDRGKIRERRAAGAKISELVEEFKVSRGFVHKVVNERV